jgi:amino acid adenylation domain-containing protein
MAVEDVQGFRLSPQQRRGWTLWRDAGTVYGARCAVLLEGDLREARLEEALHRVVDRHDILRTTFRSLPGMRFPVQVITETGSVAWSVEEGAADLSGQLGSVELLREEGGALDLETGPVLRCRLLRAGDGRHVLTFSLPPLCADGATLDNLVRDLARTYGEGAGAEVPVRYVQFSEWQNALLEDEEEGGGREYWQRQELDAASGVRFPFELPADAVAPFAPASLALRVDPQLAAAAETLAECGGADLGLLLQACWHVLLWRTTGAGDLAVAVPYGGRSHELFEEALGPFARWLPVRARLRPGRRFDELLQDLREARESAFEWGDAYERAGESGFPAAFELERWPKDEEAGGVRFQVLGKHVCSDRFHLRLACVRTGDGIRAELHFDTSRVPAADAQRLLGQWLCCLQSAVADPETPIDELDVLGETERRRLIFDLNATARDYPRDACIHHLFEAQAQKTPGAAAVAFEGRSLTYSELDHKANQLARRLRRLGVGPDVPVALCIDRSIEIVLAMLGVLKAGGAYVPLEPAQPQQRLTFMLEDIAPPVILTQAGFEDRLGAYGGKVVRIDADWEAVSQESHELLDMGADSRNLAYVIFTSGSTGRPKGVAVEHRQLVNYTTSIVERLDLPAGASFANISTFAADLGNTGIFPSLCTGGCLHVVSLERLADAREVGDYFASQGIDCLKIVPSHLEALQDQPEPSRALPRRRLVLGGEASRPAWIEELQRRVPDCTVYNHYGPSETTVGVLTYRAEPGRTDRRCSTLPLGRPIGNTRVHLLGSGLQPVPVWVPGELYIGGDGVSRGYLGRPDLTAGRFVPDPFGGEPGARLYRTGDLARYLPDGDIEFLGRVDDQVKYHGFRVELNEIRLALNQVPQVRDSVVTLARDAQGRDVLVAYYVSRHEIEVPQLRDALRRSILEETIPNLFVHLKRLPLTLNGKINYAALPSLEEARRMVKRDFVAPRNPTEEVMARIWAEVLGHERVSIHDNFFELGGHSLLATRVISRQREALQVEIPLRSLFEAPTVAALAEAIERLRAAMGGGAPSGLSLDRIEMDIDQQLAELELLSDDEAGLLLNERASAE